MILTVQHSTAKRYCRGDADCEDLGELFCIKSHCEWGTCGCPRGEATMFLGSETKYGCVKGTSEHFFLTLILFECTVHHQLVYETQPPVGD